MCTAKYSNRRRFCKCDNSRPVPALGMWALGKTQESCDGACARQGGGMVCDTNGYWLTSSYSYSWEPALAQFGSNTPYEGCQRQDQASPAGERTFHVVAPCKIHTAYIQSYAVSYTDIFVWQGQALCRIMPGVLAATTLATLPTLPHQPTMAAAARVPLPQPTAGCAGAASTPLRIWSRQGRGYWAAQGPRAARRASRRA